MTNAKRFCSASISEKITFTLKWDSWTIYYSIYIYETRLHCINVMYVNIILNRTKFRVNVIMLLILSIMIARIYVVHILSYNCTEFKKVPLNIEISTTAASAFKCSQLNKWNDLYITIVPSRWILYVSGLWQIFKIPAVLTALLHFKCYIFFLSGRRLSLDLRENSSVKSY